MPMPRTKLQISVPASGNVAEWRDSVETQMDSGSQELNYQSLTAAATLPITSASPTLSKPSSRRPLTPDISRRVEGSCAVSPITATTWGLASEGQGSDAASSASRCSSADIAHRMASHSCGNFRVKPIKDDQVSNLAIRDIADDQKVSGSIGSAEIKSPSPDCASQDTAQGIVIDVPDYSRPDIIIYRPIPATSGMRHGEAILLVDFHYPNINIYPAASETNNSGTIRLIAEPDQRSRKVHQSEIDVNVGM